MKEDQVGVGYKRPPKKSQFKPGLSGNPSGRPKGARSFKSDLKDELSESIEIQNGQGVITVSKQRALIKALVSSAIKGEARAVNTLMGACLRAESLEEDEGEEAPEDASIARAFAKSRTKKASGAGENTERDNGH